MTEAPETVTPLVSRALDELRAAATLSPTPGAVARGRGAMHLANARRPRGLAWVRSFRLAVLPAVALLALATAGVSAASAPPGSPLHGARSAEEAIRFQLASSDRARLALQFARGHLDDARHARGPRQSVDEAQQWVDRARENVDGDNGLRSDLQVVITEVRHEVDSEGASGPDAAPAGGAVGQPRVQGGAPGAGAPRGGSGTRVPGSTGGGSAGPDQGGTDGVAPPGAGREAADPQPSEAP